MLKGDLALRGSKFHGIRRIGLLLAGIEQRNMRRAEAYAVWICVMTLVTSLNGLVYWLA